MTIELEAHGAAARTLLRDACARAHARLDARLERVNFNDRAAYADMLSRMSAPLSALEGALTAGIARQLFDDWAERRRTPALREDIASLGGHFRQRFAPAIDQEAEAFGVLYVLEGSRLGGRVLARQAAESENADVRAATRFFRHAEMAGHWRSFLVKLENSTEVRAHQRRAIGAALHAFAAFEVAFA